jgi:hypothetical protein
MGVPHQVARSLDADRQNIQTGEKEVECGGLFQCVGEFRQWLTFSCKNG